MSFTRDATTGLLAQRDSVIEWFKSDDVVGATKNITKYYSLEEGYDANKSSRQNLIDRASMYLLSQIGITDAKAYWKTVATDVDDYINASDLTLVTTINNSIEPYMTPTIKATLDAILNVTY